MKASSFLSALLLISLQATAAPSTIATRAQIEPIVIQAEELNDKCRDGRGDEPATEVFCKKRDILDRSIEDSGWCWGDRSLVQSESDKQWQLCVSVPGEAPELRPVPRFDVAATCQQLSSSSEIVRKSCYQQEQISYNNVKALWMKIPKTMQDTCKSLAGTASQGSYIVLNSCIEQEMKAQDSNENFKFKY
jgi:hypothetical protein